MRRGAEQNYYVKTRGMNLFVFLAYLILGAYFINVPFNFLKIPEIVIQFDKWIVLAGGIFMLFGAIHYFKSTRR